jgi:hypothetical protein
LYVGTDGGLYVSINSGNSFFGWNNGLPKSIPVHDIALQARENEIVLGTHGRSIYIAKLDSVQLLMKDASYRNKKLPEGGKWQAALTPVARKPARKARKNEKEGVDIDCPPAKQ